MNPNIRPTFQRERFAFFRRENAGYASAISPEDPTKALHVLNPTVVEIAELCDGSSTIAQIRERYAARYGQVATSPVARYVDEAVLMLALYDLVTLELDQEPRVAGPPIPGVRRLEEWDLRALRALLSGGEFPEKAHPPVVHFRHPYSLPEVYSELLLRTRLFQQREFFYAVARGDDLDFVVSFYDERPLKPMASLALVVGTDRYTLEEGMGLVLPVLVEDVRQLLHKLEWRWVTGTGAEVEALCSVLLAHGFDHEATLADEFGPGRHEEVYSRILGTGADEEAP